MGIGCADEELWYWVILIMNGMRAITASSRIDGLISYQEREKDLIARFSSNSIIKKNTT